jgi:uncharacterized OsmC-like protein
MSSAPSIEQQAIVNGINVENVRALINTVKQNPRAGLTRLKVTNTWKGRNQMQARVESFEIGGQTVKRPFTVDIDEPLELGGGNGYANPQEHLTAALNACMMVGYIALCALQGIALEKLEIETEGEIDPRGFLGLDSDVPAGYRSLRSTIRLKGDASNEKLMRIHEMVKSTSPNYYNITRPVDLTSTFVIE